MSSDKQDVDLSLRARSWALREFIDEAENGRNASRPASSRPTLKKEKNRAQTKRVPVPTKAPCVWCADTLHWRAKVYAWDRGIGVSAAVEELLVIGQQELKGRFEVAHPDPVVAYLWRQRVRAEGVLSREERMWLERQARRARAYKVSNGLHLRFRAYARVRRVGFSQSFETFLMLAFEQLRRVGHMDLDRLVPLAMAERLDD